MRDVQDVIVVGAGLSGLVTALTAAARGHQVTVLERAEILGGAAAYSGGMVWAPGNHVAEAADIEDNAEDAATYIRALAVEAPEYLNEEALKRWVEAIPDAMRFLDDAGAVNWYMVPTYPDYEYPHAPGSRERGRFLAAAFPAPALGEWRDKLRVSPVFPMGITYEDLFNTGEVGSTFGTSVGPDAPPVSGNDLYTFGTGLVAGVLARVVEEKSIRIELGCPATELIIEDDAVVGARGVDADGTPFELHGAVVLATSGFDWNPELVKRFWGLDEHQYRSVAPTSLVGDGILLAESAGAAIDVIPAKYMPINMGFIKPDGSVAMLSEQARPHTFVVDTTGRRFSNESTYYSGLTYGALDGDTPRDCFMIWDSQHHARYAFGDTQPGEDYPFGLVTSATTLQELGDLLGVDGTELERTAERFNGFAEIGDDLDYHRGTNRNSNMWYGDPDYDNPCLGPVANSPFFGIPLVYVGVAVPGSGVSVDGECRARRADGSVVKGLYAVGSAAVFSTTGSAHGGGYALSRAITMGYIAASRLQEDGFASTGTGITATHK